MENNTCPACQGTTRKPAGDYKYKNVIAGYDPATDSLPCTNCGGQYMYGRPTGKVKLNLAGQPCLHVYQSQTVGRCLTEYTCVECKDRYQIDSGD